MDGWTRIERLSRPRPPFFAVAAARDHLVARLGPPHFEDGDGWGWFDGWCVRHACGLELGLALYRDVPLQLLVYTWADRALALEHLDLDAPPRFRVLRLDDNGQTFEVARYASRCVADAHAAALEALGHKQTYWVETLEA